MFLVIGSGPAGVACASALLANGGEVLMIDGGRDLEPERRAALDGLRTLPPSEWHGDSSSFLREGTTASTAGIPLKLAFGSEYPYENPTTQSLILDNVEMKQSWGRGGLSAVWGASILPYRDEDLDRWPITAGDLAPHYAAVLRSMPTSARADDLADLLPLHGAGPNRLPTSRQATRLLEDLDHDADRARSAGLWFGTSRLAVRPTSDGRDACVKCGLCMYGCPVGLIYNAATTVTDLEESPSFTYRPGIVVERLVDAGPSVTALGVQLPTRSPISMTADKVFVAAGVLGTTRLALTSLGAFDETVSMADSCYFLLPLLRYRSDSTARDEPKHTLAQVFLELLDPKVSPYTVHLQVYTHNELFRTAVSRLLGPLDGILGGALDTLALSRLLLIQGYLHSDDSPSIDVHLDPPGQGDGALHLTGRPNPSTTRTLKAVTSKLRSLRSTLKAIPAEPLLRVGSPGRGFHSGGTLPMRKRPGRLETDTLGRPGAVGRVHLVDSSVLPTIPATTVTLSVMANAHRIAMEALQ